MTGTRQNNTFEEQLPKLLKVITDMKMTEDADFEWLVSMETQIIEKIKQPFTQAAQMTAGPQPQPGMGMGQPQDPMMAMMAGAGQAAAPPMSRGPMPGTDTAPAVDELRRMMTRS